MVHRLTSDQKRILRKASPAAVQDSMKGLQAFLNRSRWLSMSNKYRKNAVQKIKKDGSGCLSTIKQRYLRQYITASTILHCMDGWSFLGRAINSQTLGDRDAARHLGYYAELRAAMSILANEGIGIFLDRHFVIDTNGVCHRLGLRTHTIAWLSLEYRAHLQNSANLLAQIIRPNGIALQNWLDRFLRGNPWRSIAYTWLKTWGLDLHFLSKDQMARNESSYRPNRLNNIPSISTHDCIYFTNSIWKLCEPSANAPFFLLDQYLLRLSLEESFQSITGVAPKDDPTKYRDEVKTLLSRMNLTDSYMKHLLNFLIRNIEPYDFILSLAKDRSSVYTSTHHFGVISRAFLLLRIATGICALLLRNVGFSKKNLNFWWKPIGEDCGVWNINDEPSNFSELWDDSKSAIEEIQSWVDAKSPPDITYANWHRDCSYAISSLGKCERIGLWGLEI